jgi:hypothetical protein
VGRADVYWLSLAALGVATMPDISAGPLVCRQKNSRLITRLFRKRNFPAWDLGSISQFYMLKMTQKLVFGYAPKNQLLSHFQHIIIFYKKLKSDRNFDL